MVGGGQVCEYLEVGALGEMKGVLEDGHLCRRAACVTERALELDPPLTCGCARLLCQATSFVLLGLRRHAGVDCVIVRHSVSAWAAAAYLRTSKSKRVYGGWS